MNKARNQERHHYVPQFYLRHWCGRDEKLLVHPLSGGAPFKARPAAFALEKGLYDSSKTRLNSAFDFESHLGKIESLCSPVWPEIFQRVHSEADTKKNLSRFMAISVLRHPRAKQPLRLLNEELNSKLSAIASDTTHDWIESGTDITQMSVAELRGELNRGETAVQESYLFGLRTLVENLADIFARRPWGIFQSTDAVFVTSDNPIVVTRAKATKPSIGFGTPGTEITFPLSPYKMLMIKDDFTEDGLTYPLIQIGDLNDRTAGAAMRYFFSSGESA